VLRCFEGGDVTHVEGRVDPVADAEVVETELMLADLESLEKRVPNLVKKGSTGRQGGEDRGFGARPGAGAACANRNLPG
jgi:ribosome-binding ATPase YchF (GTP1/OBG family)